MKTRRVALVLALSTATTGCGLVTDPDNLYARRDSGGADGNTDGGGGEAGDASPDGGNACSRDSDCRPSEFCEFEQGSCGGTGAVGTCVAVLEDCDTQPGFPVCGCDAEDYDSDCNRRMARTSRAHVGDCASSGTTCTSNADCTTEDEYCEPFFVNALGCFDDGGTGICINATSLLATINCAGPDMPTCGCNDQEYASPCAAISARVGIRQIGACDGDAICLNNEFCGDGRYCKIETVRGACQDEAGICRKLDVEPATCTTGAPVCGCNSQDYADDCARQYAGTALAYEGTCESSGLCDSNDDCDPGKVCEMSTETGECGTTGLCVEADNDCGWDTGGPVCSCDGQEYASTCEMIQAGVGLLNAGACTLCRSTADCTDGTYCKIDSWSYWGCDAIGSCTALPEDRTAYCDNAGVSEAVCGCDGTAYGNDCERELAGVAAIAPPGTGACCSANEPACSASRHEFCYQPGGEHCEAKGVCATMETLPHSATCDGRGPICNCTGQSLSKSGCEAMFSGIGVKYSVACERGACWSNADCPGAQHCSKYRCDEPGYCQQNFICADDFPVCGCDGETYPGDCARQRAGVGVAFQGPCGSASLCVENDDCGDDEYCSYASGTGSTEPAGSCRSSGVCRSRADANCADLGPPTELYCGCDGSTYLGACALEFYGKGMVGYGPCDPGATCTSSAECGGGFCIAKSEGPSCSEVKYCAYAEEPSDGTSHQYCGCDAVTRETLNDALDLSGGVLNAGACCKTVGTSGCCYYDVDCGAGNRCVGGSHCYGPGNAQTGVCRPRPTDPIMCYDSRDCAAGAYCNSTTNCEGCRNCDPPLSSCSGP